MEQGTASTGHQFLIKRTKYARMHARSSPHCETARPPFSLSSWLFESPAVLQPSCWYQSLRQRESNHVDVDQKPKTSRSHGFPRVPRRFHQLFRSRAAMGGESMHPTSGGICHLYNTQTFVRQWLPPCNVGGRCRAGGGLQYRVCALLDACSFKRGRFSMVLGWHVMKNKPHIRKRPTTTAGFSCCKWSNAAKLALHEGGKTRVHKRCGSGHVANGP